MPTTHRVVMRSVVTSEDGTSMVHEAVDPHVPEADLPAYRLTPDGRVRFGHVGRTTQELGDTNGR